MKKGILITATVALILLLAGCGLRYDSKSDFIIEESPLRGDWVWIVEYIGSKQDVRIPPKIGGKRVTAVMGFNNKNLTSVRIPKRVTFFGTDAFSNNQLTSVVIPNGVTEIGARAFSGNRLTGIDIPDSVTKIGDRAFDNNAIPIVAITMQERQKLEAQAEWERANPQYAKAADFETYIGDDGGVIITGYTGTNGNIRIPPQIYGLPVTSISAKAFYNHGLTGVVIPASVKTIAGASERRAPAASQGDEQSSLKDILMAVIDAFKIYEGAFEGNRLTSVTFEGTSISIGARAFVGNPGLVNVTVPANADIDPAAFDRGVRITRR